MGTNNKVFKKTQDILSSCYQKKKYIYILKLFEFK